MPYRDAHGRPELVMDPQIKRGTAGIRLTDLPDGTGVELGDLTDPGYDPAEARAQVAARRHHLLDVAAGHTHLDDPIPGGRGPRGTRR